MPQPAVDLLPPAVDLSPPAAGLSPPAAADYATSGLLPGPQNGGGGPLVSVPPIVDGTALGVAEAVERERARTRAWLHDTVLQTLELLAAGGYAEDPDAGLMSEVAAGAADRLRAEIEGELPPAAGTLLEQIHAVIERERTLAAHDIRLEVGAMESSSCGPGAARLAAAVAEALRNAGKHAGATRVLVRCEVLDGVATVVVADDGRGFDLSTVGGRAGLRHSVLGRLRHEGGRAIVDSRSGDGTRVFLQLRIAPTREASSRCR